MSPGSARLEAVRLDPGLPVPAYARPGDAGLDLGAARDITLAPGEHQLVPSGLRGEVGVLLINHGAQPVSIRRGDRIAQLVIQPVARAEIVEVIALAETSRGAGGFGHTGI